MDRRPRRDEPTDGPAPAPPRATPPAPPPEAAVELFGRLASSVSAIDRCRLEAVGGHEIGWYCRPGGLTPSVVSAAVPRPAPAHAVLTLPGLVWAGAFAVQPGGGPGAVMVVSAPEDPRPARLLRLQLLTLRARAAATSETALGLCRESVRLADEIRSVVAESDSLWALQSAQRRLMGAVTEGQGLPGVARALSEATGCPVTVWDEGGRPVAAVARGGAAGVRVQAPELPTPLLESRPFRADGWLCCVGRAGVALAVVGLHDPEADVGELGARELTDAAAICALELVLLRTGGSPAGKAWAELADGLLADEDPSAMRVRAAGLGYDLDRPHQVVLVAGDAPVARLLDAAAWAARAQHPGALATAAAGGAVIVTADRFDWDALAADLEARLNGTRFVVGTSNWAPRGERLEAARREAETAVRLGAATGPLPVVHFDDLGLFPVLAVNGEAGELRRHVRRWLGAILDYDARRRSDLVRTLSEYLERGGSVEQAAEALIIHPSTLKYRLARIAELTGLDLGDPDSRFHLQLALRAHAALTALGEA